MTGLAIVVTHVLKAGHEEAFDALMLRTLESIRAEEPGTVIYASHTVPGKPELRIFYELYRDRAAFEAHEAHAHIQHFLAERLTHIESVDVEFLDLVSGHAQPLRADGPAEPAR